MKQKHMGLVTATLICAATSAFSGGNHYGWCNGVGNPHKGSNCGGGSGNTAPTVLPSQVPTSTQQPQTGPGVPQTPPVVTTQVIVVQPQPGQTISGTSSVTPPQGQRGPDLTGNSPLIILQPLPKQTFTGLSPVPTVTPVPTPSFTGFSPVITIQPQPPQTFVGYGQVPATIIVQPIPQPSFTGGAVPNPQPVAVPNQVPQAVPSKTPQGTPYLIPSLKPQSPASAPQAKPQATPVAVPRPRPRPNAQKPKPQGGSSSHKTQVTQAPVASRHITAAPGRQAQHNPPSFADANGRGSWDCLASGHGQRKTLTNRRVTVAGALRHVGSIDLVGRDLPALHPGHANCIISVKRKN